MAFCVSGQLLSAVALAPLLIARLPRRRTSTASAPPPVSTKSTPPSSQPPPPSAVASESNPIPPAPTTERCTGPACKQKALALPNATNLPRLKWTRKEKQILTATAAAAGAAAAFNSGGDGDGDGGLGNIWDWFFSLQAMAAEVGHQEWDSHGLPADITVQLNRLSGVRRYKVSEVLFFDRRTRTTVSGAEDSFFDPVSLRPGRVYTRSQLVKELENMASGGMFDKVDLVGKTKPDGTLALTVSFTEAMYKSANAVRCINVGLMPLAKPVEADADMTDREKMQYYRQLERDYKKRMNAARQCMLPVPVQRDLLKMLRGQGKVSARLLQKILTRVQKWYHDEGYAFAGVAAGRLNSKEVVLEVVEGDITKLDIQFLDKLGNVCEGNTQPAVVHRMLPKQLRPGHVFNIEAVRQSLRQLQSLALFSSMEVNPFPDENNEGGIVVEVKLKEMEHKSSNLDTQWNIVPGRQGGLTLESIQPGGTISFEHRNIKGLNRSIAGALSSSNLLNPQDGLDFKFEYVHPYVDGVHNPHNRTFNVSCFNSRKLSPVFTGGPELDEVAPVWIDRMGIKATLTECLTQLSKFTYGLVVEEIKTRDEENSIITHGSRALPSDTPSMDGPPTTLSGSGIDRMAFVQANITRDDTKFVNGAVVGARDVFQLDQGLGIGSKFPFFNRHQLALTRFVQLKPVEEGAGKPPPPVLVLHGRYGGCVGDLPSYDAFTLGGPYSVRGYNMGELGACRNILELATEVRIPIKNTCVYAFAEHGNDLGSSKDVKGNPTEFFRRAGHGSSYGVGVKIQAVRAEYVVDHNNGTGAVSLRFGDRF